jgi:hypothetical protein
VIGLGAAVTAALVGAILTFTGPGMAIIRAVYGFLEFYSGVFSLVALSISVMVGLVATDRIVLLVRHRVLLQAVHRAMATTAMVFLGVHIFTKIVEGHASVIDVVVPFLASHRVVYVGLGTIASYLMILVTWTGIIRGRFAGSAHPGLWRALHASAYFSWVFALFHGLESGRHAKTWVTVSYVVCVIAVGLALLVRLSVSWGRRMRSPKAQTTGTIKAIGKPVGRPMEPALIPLARSEPVASGARPAFDDDPPFGRHTLEDDLPSTGRHTFDEDPLPSRRRDTDERPLVAERSGRRLDRDLPTLDEPEVEWYDEAGNRSFAAGPAFPDEGRSRGGRAARDDAPVTGQPLAPLSYLDGAPGSRPEAEYQPPEEEPLFRESAYLDTRAESVRSGTGSLRQVRDDGDRWSRDEEDRSPQRWSREDDRATSDFGRDGEPYRGGSRRDDERAPRHWGREDDGVPGDFGRDDYPNRDDWGHDDPHRDDRTREGWGRDVPDRDGSNRGPGYLDARPRGEQPERPRRPRSPVDDLMTAAPAEPVAPPATPADPPRRRRRSLAELPAGPTGATEPAGSGKPPEDISDEEFWAHMRGDVLR